MTNAVLALHTFVVLKMFLTERDPRPQAVRYLLSAVLAFTHPFISPAKAAVNSLTGKPAAIKQTLFAGEL